MPDLDRERLYKMLGNLADVVTIDDENIISVMRPKQNWNQIQLGLMACRLPLDVMVFGSRNDAEGNEVVFKYHNTTSTSLTFSAPLAESTVLPEPSEAAQIDSSSSGLLFVLCMLSN